MSQAVGERESLTPIAEALNTDDGEERQKMQRPPVGNCSSYASEEPKCILLFTNRLTQVHMSHIRDISIHASIISF